MSRYLDIRRDILERILQGVWPQGTLLPSENTLAREYGVTRSTIRQALRELEQERFLTVRQGIGRFVNQRSEQVVSILSRLESMDHMMSTRSGKVSKRIIEYKPTYLTQDEARRLQVPEASSGFRLVRIRYSDEVPAAVSINIFPEAFAPKEPVEGSLLDALDAAGHVINYAESEILVPDPEDPYPEMLCEGDVRVPVLLLRQLHRDFRHTPIFLAYDYLNMNVFSLQITRQRM